MRRKSRHNNPQPKLGYRRGSIGRATKVHVGQRKRRGHRQPKLGRK